MRDSQGVICLFNQPSIHFFFWQNPAAPISAAGISDLSTCDPRMAGIQFRLASMVSYQKVGVSQGKLHNFPSTARVACVSVLGYHENAQVG